MPKLKDDTRRLLEDIEERIDPETEEDFRRQWSDFLYHRFSGEIFTPRRRRVTASKLSQPAIHLNDTLEDMEAMLCAQLYGVANTINMKWITKEPPTLFFNEILTNSQLFCAFIKVSLQPYSLYWGYAAIFLRIHSPSSAIHQLSSKIWYSIIVAWR